MFFVNQIPHLKIYKQKTYLPVNEKGPTTGSIVFMNNKDTKAAVNLMKNRVIYNNNKFRFYYMDFMYKIRFFRKNFRLNLRKEREELYKSIESELGNVIPIKYYDMINSRNVYFDLSKYNELFFKESEKALNYKQKIFAYIDFLKNMINDPRFSEYNIKIITIDIDSWVDNVKSAMKNKIIFNNPFFIIYYAMFKFFPKFQELGDIDIIVHNDRSMVRINPSLCEEKSYQILRREILKLTPKMVISEHDGDVEKEIKIQEVKDLVMTNFKETYKFVGDDEEETEEDKKFDESMTERVDEIITAKITNNDTISPEKLKAEVENDLMNDEKILLKTYEYNQTKKVGRSTASIKRDQELREKQKQLKLGNMSFESLTKINPKEIKIPSIDVSAHVTTTNKNVTKVKYPNFEKAYNENLSKKDLQNILTCLNDKSIPVFVRDIKVEDTSDKLNLKETYTVDLEDSNRVRHRLKFDMPKFIDDKFMYLGGNKKIIIKQLFMKPVVKTGPDEVQICSNYNKIFIRRYGKKVSSKIEKLKKVLSQPHKGVVVKFGNNIATNAKYKSMIEYDEISKDISYIRINNAELFFNQDEVQALLKKYNKKIGPNEFCIGFSIPDHLPITFDINTQKMNEWDIVDFILSGVSGEFKAEFDDVSSGKKFMYSRATVMKKHVPLILLLGFFEGLSTVLRKASINHYFTDKRPQNLDHNKGIVKFADGYLVYDKYPFENSLLMNAFADIPTNAFEYEEMDDKNAYLILFDELFGSKIIGNAFINYYDFMIDPITKEVLEDLNYPTDIVSLMIYANSLLADNSYIKENNMNLYRVRSNEMVNALLYKAIANAYSQYRSTANNNNPVKISIPQDIVIKNLLTAQTVEDYSTLNPIVELEKSRAITPKGHVGLNVDDAYTQDKRSYDKTMLGILAMSTSPDANCGVVRQLSLEPNIVSPRGYIDIKEDKVDELSDVNLFSPAELLSPLGVTRDDSIRTAMATKQSKHIIPIAKSSPVLISNGVEQVIQYHLSNDFIVKAKMDGKVLDVDESTGLVIVEYTDGSKQAIDTTSRVVKNGAGGFYLSNKLTCNLKVGEKFKKDQILASDKHFFTNDRLNGNRFNIGTLQKVMCMSTYATHEDATFITKKLSRDASADIVMQKPVVIGANANVDYMVKIGDTVQVGDELIRFEKSFDEDSLNKLLASVGEELQEDIKTLGKTPIKSKYSGVIEDIKIYSTVDLEALSPSLRKIVSDYYKRINQRKKLLDKYVEIPNVSKRKGVDIASPDANNSSVYKFGILLNEPTEKIVTKDGKVKGHEVGDGVLIEFYIKYKDTLGVGDKITYFTALKSIIGEVIEEGLEPYSEYRPDEEISSIIAPSAIMARMTPSILLTMFGNKVLVELKRHLYEIYTGQPWKETK